ncbi:MAG: NUDIX hydrolase [Oligoflexia bacterium]|nr:NUDIX hydrolase [Oligoflexia bacterium]
MQQSRIVFKCRSFEVAEEQFLSNSHPITRNIVKHPGAVVILPRLSVNRYILLKQFRHALRQTILEFPAGTLNPGEAPDLCAHRELIEETGFAGGSWKHLGILYPAPGFCDEIQHLYFASELQKTAQQLDEDEIIEPVELSRQEIENAIANGELRDAKSIGIFTKALLAGLI